MGHATIIRTSVERNGTFQTVVCLAAGCSGKKKHENAHTTQMASNKRINYRYGWIISVCGVRSRLSDKNSSL